MVDPVVFELRYIQNIVTTPAIRIDDAVRLIFELHNGFTDDEKQFLLSFKNLEPDWSLLRLDGIKDLPAVKWKLLNLEKMSKDKHKKALEELKKALHGD